MSTPLAAVGHGQQRNIAEDLWSRIDAEFLASAGWNPLTETLVPQADHPLLGFRQCRVQGCQTEAATADGLCVTCQNAYAASDMTIDEFAAGGRVRRLRRGEIICAVRGCPRPCQNNNNNLCQVHNNQRKRLKLSVAQFVDHPAAQPLPGFGVCRVAVCDRPARYRRGLCGTHYARWWAEGRQGLPTDLDAWCLTAAPIASGHQVILRGLSARCRPRSSSASSNGANAASSPTSTAADLRPPPPRCGGRDHRRLRRHGLPRHVRRLGQELQSALSRGATRRPSRARTPGTWASSVAAENDWISQ